MANTPKNEKPSEEEFDSSLQPILHNIGINMRNERKRRNFSISTVAGLLGKVDAYVRLLESGSRTPSLGVLMQVCELYGCTLNDIISPGGKSHSPKETLRLADPKQSELRAAQESVLSLISSLNADELTYIADCMRGLISTLRKQSASK